MHDSLVIRILEAHQWPKYRAIRLRALADSPDAFTSTLAAEQERTPDAWAAQLSAAATSGQDCPLIAEHAGAVLGLVWAKVDASNASAIKLFQMWVAPESRGRGVAAALLHAAIAWARSRNARVVLLGCNFNNKAAVRLYVREGFQFVGPPVQIRPGFLDQNMRLAMDESAA